VPKKAGRSKEDRGKALKKAVTWSTKKISEFREERLQLIKHYVGNHYSKMGADDRIPIPLMVMAITTYMRKLVASDPMVRATTTHQQLKPEAATLSIAISNLMKEIDYGKTLKAIVLDAMFSVGIAKIGLFNAGSITVDNVLHDVGQPFVDRVDLDDFIIDMTARNIEEVDYIGDRVRVPWDEFNESGVYTVPKDLKAQKRSDRARGEGEDNAHRVEKMDTGSGSEDDGEYGEYVDLWELWLPGEGLVVAHTADENFHEVLVREWEGPERGMYKMLGFTDVPSNIMPLAPAQIWIDVFDLANNLYRKISRQAERQKSIGITERGNDEDASTVVAANDGELVALLNPKSFQEASIGGADARTIALFLQTKDIASWMAGNLDALAGLGPQSETVGQDKMMTESASELLTDMQGTVEGHATDTIQDLSWYFYYDPLMQRDIVKRVAGTDIEVRSTYNPEAQEGDFLQYNFDLKPYSLQQRSPGQKAQILLQLTQGVLLPMMPFMQAQGIAIDVMKLVDMLSAYQNLPELKDIVMAMAPAQEENGPVGERPTQSPVTTRINERVNRPGATNQGKSGIMAEQLLNGNQQGSQLASMGRPTS